MLSKTAIRHLHYYGVFYAAISFVLLLPASVWAQALEEIVVTAQRRVQSLQEVPISIETFSGDIINQQGFRSMEDLSAFSPSVEIDNRTQTQNVSIRGMGTTGNNLGLESATPIFADGVHYARTSMIMGAFLDVERLEILRGPQPLAFGQNATAGAFSINSKKPTPEWEGDLTAEAGNWERMSVEGGIGGPITDTWGIRLAGQYDRSGGYIRDVVTGDMFPSGEEAAARITLQWTPTDNLQGTLKAEWAQRRNEGEGQVMCRNFRVAGPPMTERAVTIPGYTSFTETHNVLPYPSCDEDGYIRVGLREGQAPFHRPIQGINQEDSTAGMLDITGVHDTIMENNEAHDNMDFYNYRLGLSYEFDNGITVDSNTAYLDFQRSSHFDNSVAPIVTNYQHRGEIFDMVSQEFRFLSPRGGTIEWEAGAFYQQEDLDLGNPGDPKYMTTTFQPSTRLPNRMQVAWQDTRWMSGFGGVTFNFLENKASLDVGARYTDIKKDSYITGLGATWIFDIDPAAFVTPPGLSTTGTPIVDVAGDGTAYGTNHVLNNVLQPINIATQIINCATGHRQCGSYGAGYWTHIWGLRAIPDAWDIQEPVAMGPTLSGIREPFNNAIYSEAYNDNNLDPQVTLRYRPTDNHSLYAKWARAFKGGGADISTADLPADPDDFPLAPEYAENFEVGAKGTLLDGAANYSITVFQITIKDMQVSTVVPQSFESQQNSISINAGKQRTRGVEVDGRWQVTDHLRLGMSGALMDGVMVSFPGAGCTTVEFEEAATGPCISVAEAAADPDGYPAQTIDRSGTKATRTPDWKFVADVDWWYPLSDSLKYEFSSKVSFIDDYVTDVRGYSKVSMYDQRTLLNMNVGLAGMDDTWRVFLWGRNILGDGLSYFREFHRNPNENRTGAIQSPMNWFSYGVQVQYFYN